MQEVGISRQWEFARDERLLPAARPSASKNGNSHAMGVCKRWDFARGDCLLPGAPPSASATGVFRRWELASDESAGGDHLLSADFVNVRRLELNPG